MIVVLLFALFLTWILFKIRRARRRHKAAAGPLAGIDTGTRSPYRTPSRFFGPRRGF